MESSSTSTRDFPKRINKTIISYSAGILDGEGCIGAQRQNGQIHIIPVVGTHKELVEWVQSIWGGVITENLNRTHSMGKRPCYELRLRKDEAIRYLKLVKQFLRVKRPQAECALASLSLPHGSPEKRRRLAEKIQRLNRREEDTVRPDSNIAD